MLTANYPDTEFTDFELASEWAKTSLNLCCQEGIFIGANKMIGPKRSLYRAEASVIITRLIDKLEAIKQL